MAIHIYFRTLNGNLLGLLAGFAIERPLRRQFRMGWAHFDTHEAYLHGWEATALQLDVGFRKEAL